MDGSVSGEGCVYCGRQLDDFGQCQHCDTYGTPHQQRDEKVLNVLDLVLAERRKQDKKWGQQNHDPALWYAILGEEFGEVGKEICEREAELGRGMDIIASHHADNLRTELIHLLAVGTAMLESLERNQDVRL